MAGNMTGQLLNNRYLIGERIGIGGMAEVYQGQDNVLGRTVAVKVMLPQYAEDPTFTARFRQEAAAAANLQSPYIVNVYDWGQNADTSFIVMEFVRGSDLKTAIKQRGAINQRKVAEIGSQVCQALSVAHNLDIVHRDIKPQNIMIQPDGNVKVMDFGIARAKNSVMAKTSAVLGTAHYISPEQAQGKDLSPASDIYSLGIVMYEAATGELPFDGPDAVSVAMKQVNDAPKPPSELNPDIDPALESIIMKAMAKNPRERFATSRDMRQALNDYLAGRPVNLGGFNSARTTAIPAAVPPVVGAAVAAGADHTSVMHPGAGANGQNGQRAYVEPVRTAPEKPKGKRVALIVIGAILAIAAIAALSYVLLGNGLSNGGTAVPDVVGKTSTDAIAALEDAGFKVETSYVYDDTVKADMVIKQSPRAGSLQEKGTKIELTISQGAEQVEVPDLSDMNANEAKAALQRAGLNYEAGAAEHSDTVKENRVVRQSPAAGTKVDKGTKVTYYLSAGAEQVEVPDVTGLPEGEATATLENAGFKVTVDHKTDATVPEGAVISQAPGGGGKAKKGSTVNIVVSEGATYYYVSASSNGGGSVYANATSVPEGGSVGISVAPNTGYEIASITVNGVSQAASSYFEVSNVTSDVSVYVEFKEQAQPQPSSGSSASASASAASAT